MDGCDRNSGTSKQPSEFRFLKQTIDQRKTSLTPPSLNRSPSFSRSIDLAHQSLRCPLSRHSHTTRPPPPCLGEHCYRPRCASCDGTFALREPARRLCVPSSRTTTPTSRPSIPACRSSFATLPDSTPCSLRASVRDDAHRRHHESHLRERR